MNAKNYSIKAWVGLLILLAVCSTASGQKEEPKMNLLNQEIPSPDSLFYTNFKGNTMRIDYLFSGDASTITIALWQIKEEADWAGPRKNLIDPWHSGNFRYSIIDTTTGQVLYRKGFSTLFEEFQGTEEAKTQGGAYPMTALFPYPLKPVNFVIDRRVDSTGAFEPLFSQVIDPGSHLIIKEEINAFPLDTIRYQGNPAQTLDIVFLAEGYTEGEMEKFKQDAERMADYFLTVQPFSQYPGQINFWAVQSPSVSSGVDNPKKKHYKNTAFNSSFNTFGSDRYLTNRETWKVYDAAACAPSDQIIILNNSEKYGGGGFYNHYCQSTVDNPQSEIVAIHEFGHAFGGLADEYVGGVNYDGFYKLDVEPWEPNITTLVDFGSKWASMVGDTVTVPTPRKPAYRNIVGVYEGGGYMAKGIYSPYMNCRMKDNSAEGFCPVCQEALKEKILYYCDK
jgi:hypothetical protein